MILTMISTLGWNGNPLELGYRREPIKVLWLDWETDEETARWTMTRLKRGMGIDTFYIHYKAMYLSLAQEINNIMKELEDSGAELLVLDSLGLASGAGGGNLNDAEPAIRFYSALRQLKTTSLIIAHNSKNQETKMKTIMGSMFYTAQARNIWEVKKVAEPGEDEINIALFHRKAPPFDKLRAAMGYNAKFEQDKIMIKSQKATSVREFVDEMGSAARICGLLQDNGAMGVKDIIDTLGMPQGTVSSTLKRLREKGKTVKLPDGKWGLYDNRHEEEDLF